MSERSIKDRWYTTGALIVLIIAAVIAVFHRAVGFPFLQWDDQLHIAANPFLQPDSADRYAHFWRNAYGKMYVPITYNAWGLLYSLSQKASLFHSVNIAMHALNGVLVFILLRRLTTNSLAAFAGAILFCMHPLQVESVAWVSEFRGLLAAGFVMGSLIAHDTRWNLRRAWIADIVTYLLLAAGLLSKPSALVAPGMMVALDLYQRRHVRESIIAILPAMAISIGAMLLQMQVQPVAAPLQVSWQDRPKIAVDAVWWYVSKIAAPVNLCADPAHTPQSVLADGAFAAQLMRLLVIAAVACIIRSRAMFTGLAIIIIAIAPVTGLLPFEFQLISTVADRYACLALVGVAFMIAELVRWKPAAIMLAIPAITACGVLSFRQTQTWESDQALWSHANKVNPRSSLAECNLAQQAFEARRFDEAVSRFTRAISLNPLRNNAQQGLALLARTVEDAKAAEHWYREAMRIDPDDIVPITDFISFLAESNRVTEAIAFGEKFAAASPPHADFWSNLAGAYLQANDLADAKRCADQAITLNPRHPQAHYILALTKQSLGEDPTTEMKLAAQFDPTFAKPLLWLAMDAAKRNNLADAEAYLTEAARRDPRDVGTLVELGQMQVGQDKIDQAIETFESALKLSPGNQILQDKLATAKKLRELRAKFRR